MQGRWKKSKNDQLIKNDLKIQVNQGELIKYST